MTKGDEVIVYPVKLDSAQPWRGQIVALPGEFMKGPEAAHVKLGQLGVLPSGPGTARWPVIVPAEIVQLAGAS